MRLPALLADVPTSRREHAIYNTLMVEFSDSFMGQIKSSRASCGP